MTTKLASYLEYCTIRPMAAHSNALLRVFQKNLFPDVEKDQNTQSVKVLDLNLKQDLPPDIKTTRFVKVKE